MSLTLRKLCWLLVFEFEIQTLFGRLKCQQVIKISLTVCKKDIEE